MLCERCKIREAQVTFVEVIGGTKKVLHLCSICAEKLSLGVPEEKGKLSQDFHQPEETRPSEPEGKGEELICKNCGMSFSDFQKTGRLGCAECYNAFGEKLREFLEEIHGSAEYRGRSYAVSKEESRRFQKARELQLKLKKAIEEENFEEAARIRDELKKIKEESEK